MQQNELYPAPGSRKNRKRVGRGNGSGHGTSADAVSKDRNPVQVSKYSVALKAANCLSLKGCPESVAFIILSE
jgi:hypothetical protein